MALLWNASSQKLNLLASFLLLSDYDYDSNLTFMTLSVSNWWKKKLWWELNIKFKYEYVDVFWKVKMIILYFQRVLKNIFSIMFYWSVWIRGHDMKIGKGIHRKIIHLTLLEKSSAYVWREVYFCMSSWNHELQVSILNFNLIHWYK